MTDENESTEASSALSASSGSQFLEIAATTSGRVLVSIPNVWQKLMEVSEAQVCLELFESAIFHAKANKSKPMDFWGIDSENERGES